jgi:hypothetical protein
MKADAKHFAIRRRMIMELFVVVVEGKSKRGSLWRFRIIKAELEGWHKNSTVKVVKLCSTYKQAEKELDKAMFKRCGQVRIGE